MLNRPRFAQYGLSLIELMVGITVGLVVLAGVTTFFVDYLNSNRQLVQMARLDQEMRTAMDMVVRDLKRMGYKRDIHLDILNLTDEQSSRDETLPIFLNPEADITNRGAEISFWYDVDSGDPLNTSTTRGYKLESNTLQRRDGQTWQTITDPDVTQITEFKLDRTPRCIDDVDGATCVGTPPSPAASDGGAYFVNEIAVTLTGRLTSDNAITRTLNQRVRVRADIYKESP